MEGDEFGHSPDIGKFVIRDGKTYSEHGRVYGEGTLYRWLPREYGSFENYADWTDEQRAARFASLEREYEIQKKQEETKRAARDALIESARAKITPEEFKAIQAEAYEDAR